MKLVEAIADKGISSSSKIHHESITAPAIISSMVSATPAFTLGRAAEQVVEELSGGVKIYHPQDGDQNGANKQVSAEVAAERDRQNHLNNLARLYGNDADELLY